MCIRDRDKIGYEYKMVFVNTSLENALDRNNARPRKLRDDIVTNDWNNAQKNMREFSKLFGKDFVEIRNDDDLKTLDKKASSLYRKMLSWSSRFPANKIANGWRETELLKKKS